MKKRIRSTIFSVVRFPSTILELCVEVLGNTWLNDMTWNMSAEKWRMGPSEIFLPNFQVQYRCSSMRWLCSLAGESRDCLKRTSRKIMLIRDQLQDDNGTKFAPSLFDTAASIHFIFLCDKTMVGGGWLKAAFYFSRLAAQISGWFSLHDRRERKNSEIWKTGSRHSNKRCNGQISTFSFYLATNPFYGRTSNVKFQPSPLLRKLPFNFNCYLPQGASVGESPPNSETLFYQPNVIHISYKIWIPSKMCVTGLREVNLRKKIGSSWFNQYRMSDT